MNQSHNSRRQFLKKTALLGIGSSILRPASAGQYSPQGFSYEDAQVEKDLVFLFQGDSITDGKRGRNNDPNHIMGHGYAYSIASRIGADFPQNNFHFYNKGISGNTITDLQQRWQTDTLDLQPDVLSILIGINDVDQYMHAPSKALNATQFESVYRDILRQSKQHHPTTLFVLGIPFVYPVGKRKENFETWKREVDKRTTVVRNLAIEFDAVLVDYPSVLDQAMQNTSEAYWIWDGIHPTVFAHELMAREWIKQVSTRLSFLEKYNKA